MLDVPLADFEDLVARALDEIPDELARLVDNVVVVVEDDPRLRRMAAFDAATPKINTGTVGGSTSTVRRRPPRRSVTDNAAPSSPMKARWPSIAG